ncbi:MAG: SHOCT domain-containing protein [Actinomycetota bacterium]
MTSVAMMHGGTTWMTVWAWVGLAVIVLAVVTSVWLVTNLRGRRPDDVRHELDLRYARGEMSDDEYRERRQHLGV